MDQRDTGRETENKQVLGMGVRGGSTRLYEATLETDTQTGRGKEAEGEGGNHCGCNGRQR